MSTCWLNSLKQALAKPERLDRPARVAVVGIGNEFNGDDAAGVLIARRLQAALPGLPAALIIDGGIAPENCTGALRRFMPGAVLLVDAADMGEAPGAIRWLAWDEITGLSASTHSLPLGMLAQYLAAELSCAVYLLGIQPGSTRFDTPPTPPVQEAVEVVVGALADVLTSTTV